MRRTGDQSLVKEINTSIVLETIIRDQPISRSGIASSTGLNKGTVSSLVQNLIDRKLVSETGIGLSSGGRKPVMLQFEYNAGFAIGIDLGVNYLYAALTNLNGTIMKEITVAHRNEDEPSTLELMKRVIESIISEAPPCPYGIIGIGAGVPGIADANGQILFAPNLNWHHFNLREHLQDRFQMPVFIDNEANAGAIGEQQFGAGQGILDLVYISAGIGIGSGIMMNGKIYRGSSGFSGEIGHFTINADGEQCRCGNRGCWELYASERALLNRTNCSSLEDVISKARLKDAHVLAALETTGRFLGIGIAGIVNTFNPKLIIVGNRLTEVSSWLEASMLNEIENRSLSFHKASIRIQFSQLKTTSTALGAAYSVISDFLWNTDAISKRTSNPFG